MSSRILIGETPDSGDKPYPHREIGERIKRVRGGQTQQNFSDILGIKHPQYNRYEKGRVKPSQKVLEAISAYGQVSIDWILFGDDAKPALETGERMRSPSPHYGMRRESTPKTRMFAYREEIPPLAPRFATDDFSLPSENSSPKKSVPGDSLPIMQIFELLPEDDVRDVLKVLLEKIQSHPSASSRYIREQIRVIKDLVEKRSGEADGDIVGMLLNELESSEKKNFTSDEIKKLLERVAKSERD